MMTHEELVEAARKWLAKPYASCRSEYGHSGCSVIVTELVAASKTGEIPDALGFQGCRADYTVLVECKTSYSDFLADQKKVFRSPLIPEDGLGTQRWYLSEKGIIPEEKLPDKWGLIETDGKEYKIIKKCEPFGRKNIHGETALLISAICRLHVTEPENCVSVRYYEPLKKRSGENLAGKKKAGITVNN